MYYEKVQISNEFNVAAAAGSIELSACLRWSRNLLPGISPIDKLTKAKWHCQIWIVVALNALTKTVLGESIINP